MAKICLTRGQKAKAESEAITKEAKKILRYEGITQKELADAVGVTQAAISRELATELQFRTFVAICQLTGRKIFTEEGAK